MKKVLLLFIAGMLISNAHLSGQNCINPGNTCQEATHVFGLLTPNS